MDRNSEESMKKRVVIWSEPEVSMETRKESVEEKNKKRGQANKSMWWTTHIMLALKGESPTNLNGMKLREDEKLWMDTVKSKLDVLEESRCHQKALCPFWFIVN